MRLRGREITNIRGYVTFAELKCDECGMECEKVMTFGTDGEDNELKLCPACLDLAVNEIRGAVL